MNTWWEQWRAIMTSIKQCQSSIHSAHRCCSALKNHFFLSHLIQKNIIYRYWFTVLFDRSFLIQSFCTSRAVHTGWALARMKTFNKGQRIKYIQLFWTTLNSSSQLFKPTWMSCPPVCQIDLFSCPNHFCLTWSSDLVRANWGEVTQEWLVRYFVDLWGEALLSSDVLGLEACRWPIF